MPRTTEIPSNRYKPGGRPRGWERVLVPEARNKISAVVTRNGIVHVTVALTNSEMSTRHFGKFAGSGPDRQTKAAVRRAVRDVIRDSLSGEVTKVAEAYRRVLREGLSKGDMPELKAALNKVRLQERILQNVEMADQWQAASFLGLSGEDADSIMGRREWQGRMLRFTVDGTDAYPVFQFDVDNRCIRTAVSTMLSTKPGSWSDFRLLHWLVTPHLDFGDTPARALATRPDDVLSAFNRETEPQTHG